MKFRVVLSSSFISPNGWWWRLVSAGNNKTLAHSELYNTKHDAVRTAEALADALGVILETDVHR